MNNILYILVSVAVVLLFIYSKLTPHKARLTGQYLKTFTFCEKIFDPVLNLLRKIASPLQVGNGIAVDMSQIILLIILLLVLKLI
ncbi:MAG: YggT family protein [Tannerella sp.]|jgi:uncharacterized protein YggT (Ycf19 family)|nr:YggT family protein [Tannerella sp.]